MRVWTLQAVVTQEASESIYTDSVVLGVFYTAASARKAAETHFGQPLAWVAEVEDGKDIWYWPANGSVSTDYPRAYRIESFVPGIS